MRRLTCLRVLLVLTATLLPASASAVTWHVEQLDDQPDLYGRIASPIEHFIVYTSHGLWLRDLRSGAEDRIGEASTRHLAVAPGVVAWRDGGAVGPLPLRVLDLRTGIQAQIGSIGESLPASDGRSVAWRDPSGAILVHRVGGSSAPIATDPANGSPTVYGRHVAWARSGEILVHDLVSGLTSAITQDGGAPLAQDQEPVASEGRVAFRKYTAILVHDVGTGVTTPLADFQDYHFTPLLRGDRVVWVTQIPSPGDPLLAMLSIQIHDLATGERTVVGPFTPTEITYPWNEYRSPLGFDGETVTLGGVAFGEFVPDFAGCDSPVFEEWIACLSARIEARDALLAASVRVYAYRIGSGELEEVSADPKSLLPTSVDGARATFLTDAPTGTFLATRDGDDDGVLDPDDDRCFDREPIAIGAVEPAAGPALSQVTLFGTGFGADPVVRIGGVQARVFLHHESAIVARVPEPLRLGEQAVVVADLDGCQSQEDAIFTVRRPRACGLLGAEALLLAGLVRRRRADPARRPCASLGRLGV